MPSSLSNKKLRHSPVSPRGSHPARTPTTAGTVAPATASPTVLTISAVAQAANTTHIPPLPKRPPPLAVTSPLYRTSPQNPRFQLLVPQIHTPPPYPILRLQLHHLQLPYLSLLLPQRRTTLRVTVSLEQRTTLLPRQPPKRNPRHLPHALDLLQMPCS